jgi:geranylgeranyl diphosphate synthase type II
MGTAEDRHLDAWRTEVDAALRDVLPPERDRLTEAMRYAVLGNGKRVRPLLTLAAAHDLAGDRHRAMPAACSVELVHAYSLIHDDLPAMDDDDLRRGRPTVHVAFDEATAILAGDALQALAFQTLAAASVPPADVVAMTICLARAAGSEGMVGGQALDMATTGTAAGLDTLERMHRGKTGALLTAAVELGARAAGATGARLDALLRFGDAIGLAFQIVDDLLDVTESTETQGKRAGADARRGKVTFPALLGLDASRRRAAELHARARGALDAAGIGGGLLDRLAGRIVDRRT